MVTDFGRAIRKARNAVGISGETLALDIDLSGAFLAAVERGRKKVPADLPGKLVQAFADYHQHQLDLTELQVLADLANGFTSVAGLSQDHALLVATLARIPSHTIDPAHYAELKALLDRWASEVVNA